MSRRPSKKKKPPKRKGWKTAKTADVLELYELSVQEPESEVNIIDQIWKEQRNRIPRILREDFCGTAAISIEWVKRREENNAFGIDLDAPTLEWTRQRLPDRLEEHQRSRLDLIEGDVLSSPTQQCDTILARTSVISSSRSVSRSGTTSRSCSRDWWMMACSFSMHTVEATPTWR